METFLFILFGFIFCAVIIAGTIISDMKKKVAEKKVRENKILLPDIVEIEKYKKILNAYTNHFGINKLHIQTFKNIFPSLHCSIGGTTVQLHVEGENNKKYCIITLTPSNPYPLYILRGKCIAPAKNLIRITTGDHYFDSYFSVYSQDELLATLLLDYPARILLNEIGNTTSDVELSPSEFTIRIKLGALIAHIKLLISLTEKILEVTNMLTSRKDIEKCIANNIFNHGHTPFGRQCIERLIHIAEHEGLSHHDSEDLLVKFIVECSASFKKTCLEKLLHCAEIKGLKNYSVEDILVKVVFDDKDVSLRKSCLRELISLSDKKGLKKYKKEDVLRKCLHNDSPLLRIMAAFYLGNEGLDVLYGLLLRTPLSIRKQALNAIIMIQGRGCIPSLISCYNKISINNEFKTTIISTLKNFKDQGASDFLGKELLNNKDTSLLEEIIEALVVCGNKKAIKTLSSFSRKSDVERPLKQKARQTIREIKSRLGTYQDGWLSIADKDDMKGALSSPETEEKGKLSIMEKKSEE